MFEPPYDDMKLDVDDLEYVVPPFWATDARDLASAKLEDEKKYEFRVEEEDVRERGIDSGSKRTVPSELPFRFVESQPVLPWNSDQELEHSRNKNMDEIARQIVPGCTIPESSPQLPCYITGGRSRLL